MANEPAKMPHGLFEVIKRKYMKKDRTINIGTLIKGYYIFPIAAGALLLVLSALLFVINTKAGLISSAAFVVYLIGTAIFIVLNIKNFDKYLTEFAREYGYLEGEFIKGWPIPYIVTTRQGEILFYNEKFSALFSGHVNRNILEHFSDLDPEDLVFDGGEKNFSTNFKGRYLRIQVRKMKLDKQHIKSQIVSFPRSENYLFTIFVYDETEIINLMKKNKNDEPVVGSIYIDNFDEIIDRISDMNKSLLIALVDREVNTYFAKVEGIVRKVENDKYIVIFKRKYLSILEKNKFEFLDNVRKIDVGNDYPVTISMGIGAGPNYLKNLEDARQGIQLALGRGGDQVVVKDDERVFFYGGKTKQVEKNGRVKAKFMAAELKEVLSRRDKVVIMGHKNLDQDALGAAVGIYRAARYINREAYIIINEYDNTLRPLILNCKNIPEYRDDVFINAQEAQDMLEDGAILVLVDANRPSIFECPTLLDISEITVLIDHHLQSGERIDALAKSYVEPTASSACEMVSELLQYMGDDLTIHKEEAEALYAGILIDTNYFSKNTGVKTFEAAAFLRKCGADVTKVKGLFNDSLDDFKAKAAALRTASEVVPGFAFAVCPSAGLSNPTIIAAQAANDLLDVNGIVGSFVFTELPGKIHISARSKGDVNVSKVMEKLGGGGHLNMAGAQMEDVSIEEAWKRAEYTLRKMKEEGVI